MRFLRNKHVASYRRTMNDISDKIRKLPPKIILECFDKVMSESHLRDWVKGYINGYSDCLGNTTIIKVVKADPVPLPEKPFPASKNDRNNQFFNSRRVTQERADATVGIWAAGRREQTFGDLIHILKTETFLGADFHKAVQSLPKLQLTKVLARMLNLDEPYVMGYMEQHCRMLHDEAGEVEWDRLQTVVSGSLGTDLHLAFESSVVNGYDDRRNLKLS